MMLKTVYFKARVYAFFHPFFLPINSSAPQLRHHKKGRVPFGLRLQGFSQVADVQFSQQTLSTQYRLLLGHLCILGMVTMTTCICGTLHMQTETMDQKIKLVDFTNFFSFFIQKLKRFQIIRPSLLPYVFLAPKTFSDALRTVIKTSPCRCDPCNVSLNKTNQTKSTRSVALHSKINTHTHPPSVPSNTVSQNATVSICPLSCTWFGCY